jgi:squalene-associated FAD-dependent desaturase
VLVLEGRARLGGRATAFHDRETGELVDNGQHVLFGCYHETLAFLRRVGASGNVRVQPSLEVPYVDLDGRRSLLRCPKWPAPLHLLGGILGWRALSLADKLTALRMAPGLKGAAARTRETPATVADFLTRRGQHGRIREWLWEPLAIAALNEAPAEAAAAPFIEVLARMFSGTRTNSSIALPVVPLHEMYAAPARRYVEARGGQVRLGALARVRIEHGALAGVDVRGEPVPAKAVVAAVPWFALGTLLAGDVTPLSTTIAQAAAMTAKPIVTVNLWYDRVVLPENDEFVGLPGRQMQWVFDKRRVFGETTSHLSLVASGADALAPLATDALVALAAREIAGAIPAARAATLVRGTVVREKRATFSVAPGQPPRPGVTTAVRGLFLAGDWIDTGLPATIESAAVAGHRAAAAVAEADERDSRAEPQGATPLGQT